MLRDLIPNSLIEWSTAGLVVAAASIVGAYAAIGMTPFQWAGGVAAVAGSMTLAVMVRVWPAPRTVHPLLRKSRD